MKAFRGSGGITPFFLNHSTKWDACSVSCPICLLLERDLQVLIEYGADWAPELIWRLWRTEKSVGLAAVGTSGHKPHSLFTIPTALSWVNIYTNVMKLPVPVACGLRRRSAAARLLRSWVQIPPGKWMFVCCECCVLSGRGLCDKLITRAGESYRLWCVIVWSINLKNEEAMAHVGTQSHKKKVKKLNIWGFPGQFCAVLWRLIHPGVCIK